MDKMKILWEMFAKTGTIETYLEYKNKLPDEKNEDDEPLNCEEDLKVLY